MTDAEPGRLRERPSHRFSGDTRAFDLLRIYEELADEPHDAIEGHRQIALFKDESTTVVAFLFEEGGELPEHRADGLATLHVLDGRLEIETPEEHHEIADDGMLIIRPGIAHSVRAQEPSKMILTVHLEH